MIRLIYASLSIAFACVLAGTFGALHDQISFTISPDYFHHLKFAQFRIPETMPDRIGAALVGWRASWWMGLLIGFPVAALSLFMPTPRQQLTSFIRVAVLVVLCTLAAALISLALTPPREIFEHIRISDRVEDVDAYTRVAFMHSISYLAGMFSTVIGLIVLAIWLWRARRV